MTWHELVGQTQRSFLLPKGWKKRRPPHKAMEVALKQLFALIAEEALHGRRVSIPGFGVFTLRSRKARRISNPLTHTPMNLPASQAVGFRCSKQLKR